MKPSRLDSHRWQRNVGSTFENNTVFVFAGEDQGIFRGGGGGCLLLQNPRLVQPAA